jgi:hypothetical protein
MAPHPHATPSGAASADGGGAATLGYGGPGRRGMRLGLLLRIP